MSFVEKAALMAANDIKKTLERLAQELIEYNHGGKQIALVGIHRRGVPLAKRLSLILQNTIKDIKIPVGYLDINLYRDDLSTIGSQPIVQSTEIDFQMGEKIVVLVDDVLYTGRTIRAAMDALVDYGRPKAVQLCVLIDRGHRELPIQANFVGKTVEIFDTEMVEVQLEEIDQREGVILVEKAS